VLAEIGFAYAIYPSLTSLAAATAMESVLRNLKDNGVGQPDGLFDFYEFCSLIGFEDVWAFEKKWAKD
jgi:2-methylisocitrate lyase-like PEP mutase family enzyme